MTQPQCLHKIATYFIIVGVSMAVSVVAFFIDENAAQEHQLVRQN